MCLGGRGGGGLCNEVSTSARHITKCFMNTPSILQIKKQLMSALFYQYLWVVLPSLTYQKM